MSTTQPQGISMCRRHPRLSRVFLFAVPVISEVIAIGLHLRHLGVDQLFAFAIPVTSILVAIYPSTGVFAGQCREGASSMMKLYRSLGFRWFVSLIGGSIALVAFVLGAKNIGLSALCVIVLTLVTWEIVHAKMEPWDLDEPIWPGNRTAHSNLTETKETS